MGATASAQMSKTDIAALYENVKPKLYDSQQKELEEKFKSTDNVAEILDLCNKLLKNPEVPNAEYATCPAFTPAHKSLMCKTLSSTPGLFEKLKNAGPTAKGFTISRAIQTGVMTPHLGVGCTAGDEESWEKYKELYYPVIKGWHGFDPATQSHKSDLDPTKLVQSAEQTELFNKYVASTRVRAARNVSGYSLPAGTNDEDREKVCQLLTAAFANFEGDLAGTFYPLGTLTDAQKDMLLNNGYLFQIPKTTNLLWHAGAARSWPKSRGIFHNANHTALCWVNEEDHCRIISMAKGGNIKDVFDRFCRISAALAKSAEANGTKLMYSEKLGYLGTCPSNLGTGLRASVMVKLTKFNETEHSRKVLEKVCDKFDLQPRGSAGEHSAAVEDKFDVSNKQRIGFTEVQLVQKMIDGCTKVIQYEEALAKGTTTIAQVEAEVSV